MNNFEMDEKAKELVDSKSPYEIARRLVELELSVRSHVVVNPSGGAIACDQVSSNH